METKMIVLTFLITLPQFFVSGMFCANVMRMEKKQLFYLSCLLPMAVYLYNMSAGDKLNVVLTIIASLLFIVMCLIFSKEKPAVTLMYVGIQFVVMLTADAVASVIFLMLFDNLKEMLKTDPVMMLITKGIYCLEYAAVMYGVYRLLKRKRLNKRPKGNISLYFPIPISQAIVLGELLFITQSADSSATAMIITAVAVVCTVVADILFFRALTKMQKEQVLKEQVRLANYQLENQKNYYYRLENNITTINRIRHDINNQLQTAYAVMESGGTESARAQLDKLRESVSKRIGTVYCENLFVDAVLVEKAARCEEAGISLNIGARLPETIGLDGSELCSVYANILDNAITACKAFGAGASIELNTFQQAGCLVAICENSVVEDEEKKHTKGSLALPEHGLGLGILEDIAKKHNGSLKTSREGGRFKISLTLLLPE